jgi:hypothetical protein
MQAVEDCTLIPKTEHSRDGSISSPEVDGQISVAENVQVQKRKGGRKPVGLNSDRWL